MFAVRDEALRVLEDARQGKRIGKGLEADLEIAASGDLLALLRRHAGGLKEFLNVSRVSVIESQEPNVVLEVAAVPAAGSKCARCWNFMPEVGPYGIWQNVCTRCQSALREMKIRPPEPVEAAS
jgi:isoleucyl-tRNA synthetase